MNGKEKKEHPVFEKPYDVYFSIDRIFPHLDRLWRNLGMLSFKNRTLFETIFILLYSMEQITLIYLLNTHAEITGLIVSIFAIVILTTFSLHKIIMEARVTIMEKEWNNLKLEDNERVAHWHSLFRAYEELMKRFKNLKSELEDTKKQLKFKKK